MNERSRKVIEPEMGVVCGVKGVGRLYQMCMCLACSGVGGVG